jgi:hypothetical protein
MKSVFPERRPCSCAPARCEYHQGFFAIKIEKIWRQSGPGGRAAECPAIINMNEIRKLTATAVHIIRVQGESGSHGASVEFMCTITAKEYRSTACMSVSIRAFAFSGIPSSKRAHKALAIWLARHAQLASNHPGIDNLGYRSASWQKTAR